MDAGLNADASKDKAPDGLTEQDLVLGRKASKYIDILCLTALVVVLGIAVYVFASVPLDTRLDYSGRFGRNGLPMPFVILLPPVFLFLFWRTGKKPDSGHMRRGSRVATYILGTAMIVAVVVGQFFLANSLLIEGGAIHG